MQDATQTVGEQLRDWRQRRRMSQLSLALDADISARHLSFVETGRARPSRAMVLHLADCLAVPLRARNALLLAAGFAPAFPQRPLDDPALAAARQAIDQVLAGHEPYPALAVDRHWTMIAANRAVGLLTDGVDPALLQPPVNALRVSLHPAGLAPRIRNLGEWRAHVFARLRQQIAASADPGLAALLAELEALSPSGPGEAAPPDRAAVVVPLRIATPAGELALFGTVTVFGTPVDITLAELAIEAFYPADAASAALLRTLLA
ncbi:MAG: helix-turn-helix transcriptional regulator [Alphaproteobacteria bacterium]